MLLFLFILGFLIGLVIYGFYKSNQIRKQMFDEMDAVEHDLVGNDYYFNESVAVESPTLPFPRAKELGIRAESNLEMVYNHIIRTKKITVFDIRTMQLKKASGYIYKLRAMGFNIVTRKSKEGALECYELISYKAK
jgi:hypothetical protein